ncbi:hypothetical protein AURDEDRAFT_169198 [Auricularia subglabra TFB-10046 SS5]|nr:hypothetical protein AURDEDRAFT_169198 [Auricularia subglabra TFB-10046 SS5]
MAETSHISTRTTPIIARDGAGPVELGLLNLPVELVIRLLDFLPPKDLRSAANTLRKLYQAAVIAGLCIFCEINASAGRHAGSQLAAFREAQHHAQLSGVGLSVDVGLDARAVSRSAVVDALSAVTVALPYIVHLAVQLPDGLIPDLCAALHHPALRLRSLHLAAEGPREKCAYAALDNAILEGCAPQLTEVELQNLTLAPGSEPLSAFARVRFLDLDYLHVFPAISVAHHFPRLVHLRLDFDYVTDSMVPARRDFVETSLKGLSLSGLVITDFDDCELMPYVARAIDLASVPNVQHRGSMEAWGIPFWHQNTEMLNLRLSQMHPEGTITMLIVPVGGTWHYSSQIDIAYMAESSPISGRFPLRARLVYIRLDAGSLIGFLRNAVLEGGTYPALRHLRLDI